jgi:hypothetical protein
MDWDLWCRLSRSGARFLYLKDVLAAVRCYPGTKTASGTWKRYVEILRIEHRYGKRLVPMSWLGTYLYDLQQKEKLAPFEKVSKTWLNLLRKLKRRLSTSNIGTLYGFSRFQNEVNGEAVIHIPWYGKNEWSSLILKVNPKPNLYNYIVKINERDCEITVDHSLQLVVKVPYLNSIYRKITIKCLSSQFWQLIDFQYQSKL